jgi:hypothetical protein
VIITRTGIVVTAGKEAKAIGSVANGDVDPAEKEGGANGIKIPRLTNFLAALHHEEDATRLAQTGVHPDQVGAVYAASNGAVAFDRLEAEAVADVFGGRPVAITSIKGAVGEGGMAGAASLVVAVLAGRQGVVAPTAGLTEPDPACGPAGWVMTQPAPLASPYILVNRDGAPTHIWPKRGGWHKLWLRTLAGDAERVFLISDSRFALAYIVPMRDPRFHVLHLMHNTHTVGERRWDSTLTADYGPLLQGIHKIDCRALAVGPGPHHE